MSELFSWKNSHFGNKLTNEFLVFFSPPTTPFYVKLKKYRVHNAALKIHFPPMKTLLHFHFSFKYIFIFSGKFLSWHVFVQQKTFTFLNTWAHKNIFVSPFTWGDRVWGCACECEWCMDVWMYRSVLVRVLISTRLRAFEASTVSIWWLRLDVHTTWSFQMNWREPRKNSKFNNWRVRKLSRFSRQRFSSWEDKTLKFEENGQCKTPWSLAPRLLRLWGEMLSFYAWHRIFPLFLKKVPRKSFEILLRFLI
jgi:hypothetical protein